MLSSRSSRLWAAPARNLAISTAASRQAAPTAAGRAATAVGRGSGQPFRLRRNSWTCWFRRRRCWRQPKQARRGGGRAGREQGADPELPAEGPEHHPGQARLPGRGGPAQQIPAQVVVGDRHLQAGAPRRPRVQARLLQAPDQGARIDGTRAADPHPPGTQGRPGGARVQPQARPEGLVRPVQPRRLVREVALLFQELQGVVDLRRPRRGQRGRDLLRRPGAVQERVAPVRRGLPWRVQDPSSDTRITPSPGTAPALRCALSAGCRSMRDLRTAIKT